MGTDEAKTVPHGSDGLQIPAIGCFKVLESRGYTSSTSMRLLTADCSECMTHKRRA